MRGQCREQANAALSLQAEVIIQMHKYNSSHYLTLRMSSQPPIYIHSPHPRLLNMDVLRSSGKTSCRSGASNHRSKRAEASSANPLSLGRYLSWCVEKGNCKYPNPSAQCCAFEIRYPNRSKQ